MIFSRFKLAGLLAVLVVLGACAARSLYLPTTDRLRTEGGVDAERDLEPLRRGRVIALTRCADCHRTYGADEVSPARWPSVVRDMGRRASLTRAEAADLRAYFDAASRGKGR